jgi:hypothetical protein
MIKSQKPLFSGPEARKSGNAEQAKDIISYTATSICSILRKAHISDAVIMMLLLSC